MKIVRYNYNIYDIVRLISSSTSIDGDLLHIFLRMGQTKRNVVPVASRHMVCCNCRRWVEFKSSGCGKTWAETRGKSFAFTCKGCTEVTVWVKEVEGLNQMVEDMKETVAGR